VSVDAARVLGHKEWARPAGRKVDPKYDMAWRRSRVAALADKSSSTTEEDPMAALSDDQQRQLFNAAIQTRDIAGGARGNSADAVAEVRALRAEVAALASRPGQDVTIDYDALAAALLRRIAGQ
jgi:hypothetical protein